MRKVVFRFVVLFVFLISLVQLSGCSGGGSSSQTQAKSTNTKVSTMPTAPLFSAQDPDGNWHSSTEWIGKKPVVINFWGTWCTPCRREIPDLAKLYDDYSLKGVEIISLAVNDSPGRVKEFAAENNMNWVLLMAVDQILIDYRAFQGVPTTIFIDGDGHEVGRFIGIKDYDALKRGFDSII